jgi:hypothetical protein
MRQSVHFCAWLVGSTLCVVSCLLPPTPHSRERVPPTKDGDLGRLPAEIVGISPEPY